MTGTQQSSPKRLYTLDYTTSYTMAGTVFNDAASVLDCTVKETEVLGYAVNHLLGRRSTLNEGPPDHALSCGNPPVVCCACTINNTMCTIVVLSDDYCLPLTAAAQKMC